jgi:hypothetical protein
MNKENQNPVQKMSLYFSRTGTMVSFLTTLKLYEPGPEFNSENIQTLNENRLWRLSKIDPLNSNIAFVLYKYNGLSEIKPEYIIKVFHNEKQVRIAGCDGFACDFNSFFTYYSEFLAKCKDSRQICRIEDSTIVPKFQDLNRIIFYVALIVFVVSAVTCIFCKAKVPCFREQYSRFF